MGIRRQLGGGHVADVGGVCFVTDYWAGHSHSVSFSLSGLYSVLFLDPGFSDAWVIIILSVGYNCICVGCTLSCSFIIFCNLEKWKYTQQKGFQWEVLLPPVSHPLLPWSPSTITCVSFLCILELVCTFFFWIFIEFVTVLLLFVFLAFGPEACGILTPWLMRDQTYNPCIGRQGLNHWTTREVSILSYLQC